MRKYLLVFLAFLTTVTAFAQNNSDPQLSKRLDEYMSLTRHLKFEEIMNYTHPKMFTIATREQLIEVFKQSFDNEQMSIGFDSTAITGVSDEFKTENVAYRKIDYWMKLSVLFKDTAALNDENFIGVMKMSFENAFPGGSVLFSKELKKFEIRAPSIMIAIKDSPGSLWMFLGYQRGNDALLKMLYPQPVIEHFKLL